jgi:hypothetical protein
MGGACLKTASQTGALGGLDAQSEQSNARAAGNLRPESKRAKRVRPSGRGSGERPRGRGGRVRRYSSRGDLARYPSNAHTAKEKSLPRPREIYLVGEISAYRGQSLV